MRPVGAENPGQAPAGKPGLASAEGHPVAPDAQLVRPAMPARPGAEAAATGERPARRRRFTLRREVRWTVTVLVLAFVTEYLLLPEIASARKSVNLLGKVTIWLLVLALVAEVASLVSYAQLTHTVLSPNPPRRWRLFRINMSTLAVSHVIPGGTAPGTALGYRLLTDSGVDNSTAAFGLATQGVGSAVVLNAVFWLALLISIPLSGVNALYGVAAICGAILLALFAGTVLLLTRGRQRAAERLVRLTRHIPFVDPARVAHVVSRLADRLQVLLQDREMLKRALLWASGNWLLDAASLWIFLFAYGKAVFPIDLLVAYGLANILAVIPITPGGLGVVEGVLIPTLVGFGVPKGIAILGVLTYRLVNFWLPIPLGGAAYLSLRLDMRRARPVSATRHHPA